MIGNKQGMGEILRTILLILAIGTTIVFLIWLFYGNGINVIKAKTNTAITGEPFNKSGENVRSWASNSESDCRRDCMWDTREENPIYIWEETNRSEYELYGQKMVNIEGRCYCKY